MSTSQPSPGGWRRFQASAAYDSRYRGESGGEPRAWKNPFHKVEDLKAAVAYLKSRPDVDSDRVSILAICQGGSTAFRASSEIGGLVASVANAPMSGDFATISPTTTLAPNSLCYSDRRLIPAQPRY